jgi:hypothetical protein
VFSLKATELKCSWIGIALWFVIASVYAALFHLYWMPVFWRALFYILAGLFGVLFLFRVVRQSSHQIGIDEQGVFLLERGRCKRLLFIRSNDVQLIAKVDRSQFFSDRFWPVYRVIYRDNVTKVQYRILRSFAAQQILLRRSEAFKKRMDRQQAT